ncbi:MAG: DUF72 domain-containing protein [Spirochaetales bacterium]|nr:DUF72 domain-containing protein [Spirochaetales bacterium]
MSKIIIGTSGYSYKDWVGPVYPPGTTPNDYLNLYAKEFSIVELNFSYYKMPDHKMLEHMLLKTPPEFLFSIKAHKSLTHDIDSSSEENSKIYKENVYPLIESNRIGALLFQFPYSFHYTVQNRKYLDKLCRGFEGLPTAFEFRSDEWIKESVFETLKERKISFVNVDEPPLPKLIPPTDVVTADPGYIRFHGRNKANWWKGTNVSRYDYLYDKEEINTWISKIAGIMEKVKILLVAFNNHYKGQAVKNARMLKEILKEKGIGEVL